MGIFDFGFNKKKTKSSSVGTLDRFTESFGSASFDRSGVQSEQLIIDEAGVQKITQDLLSGQQGLGGIFQAEQGAGVHDSSVAIQLAGDLSARVVGEIAKLTAERRLTSSEEGTEEQEGTEQVDATETQKSKGKSSGFNFGFSIPGKS
jgi:hypothetical protein